MKFDDYQGANVKYLYKIDGLASWTKKPEFRTAFPYIAQIIDAAGKQEQQGAVKLTSLGGSAKGRTDEARMNTSGRKKYGQRTRAKKHY